MSTSIAAVSPEEEKKFEDGAASAKVEGNTLSSAPPAPASSSRSLQKSSYYAESFQAHFFPHPMDDGLDASTFPPGKKLSLFQRYAVSQARRPWTHIAVAFVTAAVLSFVGLRLGNFKVEIDNKGWWSRGTMVADRATQERLVTMNRENMFRDDTGEVWEELMATVQPSWQGASREAEEARNEVEVVDDAAIEAVCSGAWYGSPKMVRGRERNLAAIWKGKDADDDDSSTSALDAEALYDLCVAEENTLRTLEDRDLCYQCPDGRKCVEPYSLVLLARLHLTSNKQQRVASLVTPSESISCDDLRSRWTEPVRRHFTLSLKICVNWSVRIMSDDMENEVKLKGTNITVANPCPFPVAFFPSVVDSRFPESDPPLVRYTSSYYATLRGNDAVDSMFQASESGGLDRSDGDPLGGAYDTTEEDFSAMYADEIIGRDMMLAVGSAGVTIIAMMVHTKSPFLTVMGLFQIVLSFPLAYFVYYFMGGLRFFPFLNFIGIFVVFALGADDVFVAVDKWKNARHELPQGTTEQVAALALPDAAYAMLLTSVTTAVAFFSTAISPVGPIVCFAVFCGLLITIDYLMNILLVFPALCLYDRWMLARSTNCCASIKWGKGADEEGRAIEDDGVDAKAAASDSGMRRFVESQAHLAAEDNVEHEVMLEEEHNSLIHRILDSYYRILHKFRWFVLVASVAGFAVSTVFAAKLSLPVSSEVSVLPESNEYQQHWEWKQNLLSTTLAKEAGSSALISWGLKPADTGDHLDPHSWTTLVLDEAFNPRSEKVQLYLLGFCERLFAEFGKVNDDYECPINLFDKWLKEQSEMVEPAKEYVRSCNRADAVPVPPDSFDPCIIAWSKLHDNSSVLQTMGRVKIMDVVTKSRVVYDAPFAELKDEWTAYEDWLREERERAPEGANKQYHSNLTFWWYDTNQAMLRTAYGAAGIALICAAVVVFISSRSFVLTLFAALSIAYVLVAATACLVGLGWELGFLESILFAILIGISCDFVIHVGHAYTMYSGNVSRHNRSHFALTHMGPSILAAAFTTFMAAVVMYFTEITFFSKFAVMLFMTIVHSMIGCFVVFLVLCDCIGPAQPTKGYDTIRAKFFGK